MTPKSSLSQAGLAGEVFVLFSVRGDCVSVSDEPCPNVFTLTRYAAQNATVLVVSLNRDLNVLAADGLDQCNLDALSVIEPVTVLVFRYLTPLGCIESSKAYGVPRDPYPIAVGHICLTSDRVPGLDIAQALEALEAWKPRRREQALEELEEKESGDKEDKDFHCYPQNPRETGDVVELLERLCSHRMLEEVGWKSDMDPPPGKPLQHLHRQGITQPVVQFIPIIQQRPLDACMGVVTGIYFRSGAGNGDGGTDGFRSNIRIP